MTHPDPILIIDDDALIRETLQGLLEFEGYAVVPARDGEEGLHRLRNGLTPALIVLDLTKDANQFRREQLKHPHLASIPTIVWSATSVAETQDGLWSGTIFLRKGIEFDTLLACITDQPRTSWSHDVENAGWGSAHGMSSDTSEFLAVEGAEERGEVASTESSRDTQPDAIQVQFRLLGVPCVEHHGAPPDHTAVHEALADGTERCKLREQLIAVGSDCVRACDLNTNDSPISRFQRATMV